MAKAIVSDLDRRRDDLTELIEMMRPAVQADGGDIALTYSDVESGIVEVELRGSCSSCAISTTTIKQGVERILRSRLPWITEVRGGVDDSMSFEESSLLGRGGYVPSGF